MERGSSSSLCTLMNDIFFSFLVTNFEMYLWFCIEGGIRKGIPVTHSSIEVQCLFSSYFESGLV